MKWGVLALASTAAGTLAAMLVSGPDWASALSVVGVPLLCR